MIALKKNNKVLSSADEIYRTIIDQARQPHFYAELGVPDTVDGRFELISVHAFLVLRRLKPGLGGEGQIGQAVFDTMFEDMDLSLREMGAGDIGVGKRIKSMVQAFYGRVASYDAGLASADRELEEALRRNVYGTSEPVPQLVSELANYMRRQEAHLAGIDIEDVKSGAFDFAALE
ncbi:MAG: ubiquinol-cytochrome C chaperone family protein [Pseudomonadota bacterium]|nr:ubiquinol-cytochrome C chaperone family protein [Pseudomonadota bacterium]